MKPILNITTLYFGGIQMRIDMSINSVEHTTSSKEKQVTQNEIQVPKINASEAERMSNYENEWKITNLQIEKAVNSVNELLEGHQREVKFEYHEGLNEYFVQLVDADTKEVVREIPPKKFLDIYYEMQKLAGIIIDRKI